MGEGIFLKGNKMAVRYFTCPNTPYEYFNGVFDLLPDLQFENGVACADVDEFQQMVYTRKLIIITGDCKVYTPEEWNYKNDTSWKDPIVPGYEEESRGEELPEPEYTSFEKYEEEEPEMGDIIVTDEFAADPRRNSIARKQTKKCPPKFNKLTLAELKAIAKERGIKGWYRMSSAKLQGVLSDWVERDK